MADRLDILIFGATGFAGIHCIPYVDKFSKRNGRNLSWGVAGRSEEKLKEVLKTMQEKTGSNFDNIPIVVADIKSHESLVNMAKRTRLVMNLVGPYRFLGDAVVKACIEAGTHHVDISGEPEYMERVQLEQHEAAVEKGVYAISSCGFDSIPADLGIIHLQQNFEGTLNSVETYLRSWKESSTKGSAVNFGTWETVVYSVAHEREMKDINTRFYQKYNKAPIFPPKLKSKNLPHKTELMAGWVVPFPGADGAVAGRTQDYMYEHENQRPVQVSTYYVVPSFGRTLIIIFFASLLSIFGKFKCGTNLLLKYPGFFTGGFVSKTPPSEETIESSWFSIDFYGQGWKEKLPNKDGQYTTPINRTIRTRVKGRNPVYSATCLALVLAGITLLTETDKLANNGKGGIYPPGAAFAKTSLIKQLNENGLTFEIISQQDI